jgi:hypothetical protein
MICCLPQRLMTAEPSRKGFTTFWLFDPHNFWVNRHPLVCIFYVILNGIRLSLSFRIFFIIISLVRHRPPVGVSSGRHRLGAPTTHLMLSRHLQNAFVIAFTRENKPTNHEEWARKSVTFE